MKLLRDLNQLNENTSSATWAALMPKLISECGPYLEAIRSGDMPLYRGLDVRYQWSEDKIPQPKDRHPVATPPDVHTAIDDAMSKDSGFRARSQGIFCTTDRKQTAIYGQPYYVLPIGNFVTHWITDVYDLYLVMRGSSQGLDWNKGFARDIAKNASEMLGAEINTTNVADFMTGVWFRESAFDDAIEEMGGRDKFLGELLAKSIPGHYQGKANGTPSNAKEKAPEIMLEAPNGHYLVPAKIMDELYPTAYDFFNALR